MAPRCSDPKVRATMPFCLEDSYSKHQRPFRNSVLNIILDVWVTDIVYVIDYANTLTIDMFVDMYWKDSRIVMSQNESFWQNNDEVAVDRRLISFVWMPDLDIYNVKTFEQSSIIDKLGFMPTAICNVESTRSLDHGS
jgi:hypothetical protein